MKTLLKRLALAMVLVLLLGSMPTTIWANNFTNPIYQYYIDVFALAGAGGLNDVYGVRMIINNAQISSDTHWHINVKGGDFQGFSHQTGTFGYPNQATLAGDRSYFEFIHYLPLFDNINTSGWDWAGLFLRVFNGSFNIERVELLDSGGQVLFTEPGKPFAESGVQNTYISGYHGWETFRIDPLDIFGKENTLKIHGVKFNISKVSHPGETYGSIYYFGSGQYNIPRRYPMGHLGYWNRNFSALGQAMTSHYPVTVTDTYVQYKSAQPFFTEACFLPRESDGWTYTVIELQVDWGSLWVDSIEIYDEHDSMMYFLEVNDYLGGQPGIVDFYSGAPHYYPRGGVYVLEDYGAEKALDVYGVRFYISGIKNFFNMNGNRLVDGHISVTASSNPKTIWGDQSFLISFNSVIKDIVNFNAFVNNTGKAGATVTDTYIEYISDTPFFNESDVYGPGDTFAWLGAFAGPHCYFNVDSYTLYDKHGNAITKPTTKPNIPIIPDTPGTPGTGGDQGDRSVSSAGLSGNNPADSDQAVVVHIRRNQTRATINANTLRNILRANDDLVVTEPDGDISITLSTQAMLDAGIDERALHVGVSKRDANDPGDHVLLGIQTLDGEPILLVVADFSVTQGGTRVTDFDTPVTLSMSLAGFDLTDDQIADLVGVRFNPDGTATELGGRYDPVTKIFSFQTTSLSTYGVVLRSTLALAPPLDEEAGADAPQLLMLTVGSLSYWHNGVEKTLPAAPIIQNDSTLVPLRFIAEAFGAAVAWEEESETAVITQNGKTLRVTVGVLSEGMHTPAVNHDGSVLVPLRFIGEAFGCSFEFDAQNGRIYITK
jgi:hypothetical protein